ncbi:KAP family NTPase [Pseudoalteromonas shioyasakiensis]|uniref:KAP family P-loop NTPase fold protein n=1 Tax=Pseudoalteromonas shioyasakiensis TaxID=1190813 RepID=UPI0021196ADB|nr:KAP family NTPase [Pseudoalteromonas shioyasakiensis]
MIIKNREIVVEPGSPFLNDELNRLESAEVLTQFVLSTQDPMVVCLDAPWGQGKTTFLRMWEQHLKDNEVPTIYFNAWENDFTDDALVSIIGEISSGIDELSTPEDISKTKEYLDKAKGFGVTLLKRTVPVAAKIATAGALDLDKVTEQALAGFAESIAKEELESYEKSKNTLSAFRDSLQELATSISSKENPKPLVFIIDELDRCRPNFSIEVLEKAKHFFNVSNIVFVLGADKTQLGHSIKAVYGQDLNVNGYLRRFIDFDYLLPPPEKGLFVKALFKRFDFNSYFSTKTGRESQYEGRQSLEMFSEFFEIYNLTLREQEHCCSLLSLAIRTTPKDYALYPLFLCYLIVLKVKEPDLYKSFVNEEMTPAALFDHLSSKRGAEELIANNYGAVLETYIMTCKSHRHGTNDVVEKYNEVVNSTTASDEQKARAKRILELINKFDWDGGVGILGYLVNKIEIASRFSS